MSGLLLSRRGAIAATGASPEELFEDYVSVESWSWPEDRAAFVLDGFSEVTVGEQPALRPTAAGALATALTTALDLADTRVTLTYLPLADDGFTIDSIAVGPAARWTSDGSHWELRRGFADAASALHAYELGPGLPGGFLDLGNLGNVADLDKADTTTPRVIVMDNFLDLIRGTEWFSDDAEPTLADYLGQNRGLPWSGFGGTPDNAHDNIVALGAAGVRAQYGSAILGITVERLARTANALVNGDASIIDSTDQPYFWSVESTDQTGGNGCHLVSTDGPTGETETVYEARRVTAPGEGVPGPEWGMTWALIDPTTHPAGVTRSRPELGLLEFPELALVSGWFRGVGLANSGVGTHLTTIFVVYYWDVDNATLMGSGPPGTGQDYHFDPVAGASDNEWVYVDRHPIPLYSREEIVELRLGAGLHDGTASGRLQFSKKDLKVEFV